MGIKLYEQVFGKGQPNRKYKGRIIRTLLAETVLPNSQLEIPFVIY